MEGVLPRHALYFLNASPFYPQILHGLQWHLHSIPSSSTSLGRGAKNFNYTLAVDLFFLIIISLLTDVTLFRFPGLSDHCLSFDWVLRFCLCTPSLLCRLTNLIHSMMSNMIQILLIFVADALWATPQISSAHWISVQLCWTAPCILKNALGVSPLSCLGALSEAMKGQFEIRKHKGVNASHLWRNSFEVVTTM